MMCQLSERRSAEWFDIKQNGFRQNNIEQNDIEQNDNEQNDI